MSIMSIIERIYNAVTRSYAMKKGLQPVSTPDGPIIYERATGRPILGPSGEALDNRFIPKIRIDVCVLTRNSGAFLDNCLTCIKEAVNLNKLIIVDGGSTDGTLDIARIHGAEIYHDGGSGLGRARMIAIKKVSTPWFAFIDSDVMLPRNWGDSMEEYRSNLKFYKVVALESLPLNVAEKGEEAVTETHNKIMRRRYSGYYFYRGESARGFTGATLINTRVVKDTLMPDVPCCEDWVLTQHVLKKGLNWVRVPIPVDHHDRYSERPDRIAQTHAVARTLGYMSLRKLILKSLTAMAARLMVAIQDRNPPYFLHRILYTRHALNGWLHPKRYLKERYPGWEP